VERQRRKKHEGSMLQKAMDLKKKRNLEPFKVNPFFVLQYTNLNQIAIDASVSLGEPVAENINLIDNLVNVDREQYNKFVSENPEVNLPASLENVFEQLKEPIKEVVVHDIVNTPEVSIKRTEDEVPWTEVVRRGANRIKSKSLLDKINPHERCILEY
jgi:hypothetical protein